MRPRIPKRLFGQLARATQGKPAVRYKIHMPSGRTYYAVEIDNSGFIIRIDERQIFSGADVGFHIAAIKDIEPY